MLFSIIIPTYNRGYKILDTITSLGKQSFRDFEIIVVDDGSTDDTETIIRNLHLDNLSYYYKENGGKHTALNLGYSKASGELSIILDSDDRLTPTALEEMSELWESSLLSNGICGLMGRCVENGHLIGKEFNSSPLTMSYIDFHFGPNGGEYKDCCECIVTDVIKKYKWPEDKNTKFVPESYVMDKIGLEYNLICVNNVWEEKEYLSDGITKNVVEYQKRNCVGYLYNTVSKLDEIFPRVHVSFHMKVSTWWQYWNLVSYDRENLGARVKKTTILGWLILRSLPLLNLYKRKRKS